MQPTPGSIVLVNIGTKEAPVRRPAIVTSVPARLAREPASINVTLFLEAGDSKKDWSGTKNIGAGNERGQWSWPARV